MATKTQTTNEDSWMEFYAYAWQLEERWRSSLPHYSDKELLQIFPEAKVVIPEKISEWQEKYNEISNLIRAKLLAINYLAPDSHWLWRKLLKITDGTKLLEAENQILRLKRLQMVGKGRVPKGQFTKEEIQQAKIVPIENLLKHLQLKRSGNKLVACCPLHNEKTASFFIYPQNTFYCFGCQRGGDVIDLVMLLHDFGFAEGVRWLNGL